MSICLFYHPSFELVTQEKIETEVVKRANLTYNSLSNNVAERVVRFLLLVLQRLNPGEGTTFCNMQIDTFPIVNRDNLAVFEEQR